MLDFRFPFVAVACLGLAACGGNDTTSSSASIISPVALNDTGVTRCADQLDQDLNCPVATHLSQDAENGRDVTLNDSSDGNAGFSFSKLDSNGQIQGASATSWDCVLDNVTGLIWEVKTPVVEPRATVAGAFNLRANTNNYTWYDASRPSASGDRGVENGGVCYGADSCDTAGYVAAINNAALCGFNDWRLPTREELHSIVDYSQDEPGPMLDTDYFPEASNSDAVHGLHTDWYWTSQTAAGYAAYAWAVNFNYGGDSQTNKTSVQSIRLVRGGS